MLDMFGLIGYFCLLALTLYSTLLVKMRINNDFFVDVSISGFRCLHDFLSGVLRSMANDIEILPLQNVN